MWTSKKKVMKIRNTETNTVMRLARSKFTVSVSVYTFFSWCVKSCFDFAVSQTNLKGECAVTPGLNQGHLVRKPTNRVFVKLRGTDKRDLSEAEATPEAPTGTTRRITRRLRLADTEGVDPHLLYNSFSVLWSNYLFHVKRDVCFTILTRFSNCQRFCAFHFFEKKFWMLAEEGYPVLFRFIFCQVLQRFLRKSPNPI